MPSTHQKFSVGLFVLISGSLIVFFMLLLGVSDVFHEGQKYAAYFEESIEGLNPGAEVTYRGVEIGRVESMRVAPDGKLVEVILRIKTDVKNIDNMGAMIRGGGITGIMNIELQRRTPAKKFEEPELTFEPEYPVIATRASEMSRMMAGINEVINNLKELKINKLSGQLETTLKNFNRMVVESEIDEVSTELRKTIEKTNAILDKGEWHKIQASLLETSKRVNELADQSSKTVSRIDTFFEINEEPIEQSIVDAGEAADSATHFFKQASGTLSDTEMRIGKYDQELTVVVNDLQQAAKNLNRVLDKLSNHPSQFLFGRPVPPKPIEE